MRFEEIFPGQRKIDIDAMVQIAEGAGSRKPLICTCDGKPYSFIVTENIEPLLIDYIRGIEEIDYQPERKAAPEELQTADLLYRSGVTDWKVLEERVRHHVTDYLGRDIFADLKRTTYK